MDLEQTIQGRFQVPEPQRKAFIDEAIMNSFPFDPENGNDGAERTQLYERISTIVTLYAGQDANVLSILGYAAAQWKTKEYLSRLEVQASQSIQYVHPILRPFAQAHTVRKQEQFFLGCYLELGIEPDLCSSPVNSAFLACYRELAVEPELCLSPLKRA